VKLRMPQLNGFVWRGLKKKQISRANTARGMKNYLTSRLRGFSVCSFSVAWLCSNRLADFFGDGFGLQEEQQVIFPACF
jgi:hypothetical protein